MNRKGLAEIKGLAKLWLIEFQVTEAAVLVGASPVKRNILCCVLLQIKSKWIGDDSV